MVFKGPAPLHPKVGAMALATPVALVAVWIASKLGLEIPGDVQLAIAGILGGVFGYIMPSPPAPPAK
jgi:hypothetical protein